MDRSDRGNQGLRRLPRVIGLPGAVLLGLGSIVGTGIFVSIGIAAGIAGPAVILSLVLAAATASCNGLSSARLAASHPVSGGTYEYGYRYLNPALGFLAGWLFVCAKSASAATAALGLSGYVLSAFGVASGPGRIGLGLAVVLMLTAVVAGGMRRSNRVNAVMVAVTLAGLGVFLFAGLPSALREGGRHFTPFLRPGAGWGEVLHAAALLFVAYTGYGRIATLGEEVRDPARTIPRAILITLLAALGLYLAVAGVAVGSRGYGSLAEATRAGAAPLEALAEGLGHPAAGRLVAVAAVTAMAGVLLNLLLGISRVLLAMARRGDVPSRLGAIDAQGSPRAAVIATGLLIAALAATGSVKTTWSFSAFTVLAYYALTNLAALRMPQPGRRYPRVIPMLGLSSCLGLAFWVESAIWLGGIGLMGAGLAWRLALRRIRPGRQG